PGTGPWRVGLPAAPAGASPCPSGGAFTGVVPRGEYVCDDVTFDGPVTLAPGTAPLVLHVGGSVRVNGVVNGGGSAADVLLFAAGGDVRLGETAASAFVGAIEAPSARLVLGDWQVDVTGAVSIGSVATRPGFHTFRHDPALDDVQLGGWTVTDWHQLTNA
ncbi:MAG: hypothetical protein JWO37_2049, partial [Acidimicrobiales bacterium]|nr:hypothetical protein [Acidimicrobiales bacterium]